MVPKGYGEDLWLLTVDGKDAPDLLRQIAETVKLPK